MAETTTEKTVTLLAPNGVQVTVAESKMDARVAAGYTLPGKAKKCAKTEPEDTGYASLKVADLKGEIEKRNADREDDAKLSTDGNKADLVAALEADDKAQANN